MKKLLSALFVYTMSQVQIVLAQESAFGEGKRLQKYVNRKKLVILVLVASKNNTILFDVL